jgi:Amt family ammonium transporter
MPVPAITPERLELEVTEGVLIDDDRRAKRILLELKKLGVSVALDDFGTGYSSLSYLGSFPFDTIKIDRSFVRELAQSENARAIVRTIVGLGKGLNMHVVAEGVEGIAEARLLAEIGCRELQGFLLGKPAALGELASIDGATVAEIMSGQPNFFAERLGQTARSLREAAQAGQLRRA